MPNKNKDKDDKSVAFVERSLSVRSCMKCVTFMDSSNPHDTPSTWLLLQVGRPRPSETKPQMSGHVTGKQQAETPRQEALKSGHSWGELAPQGPGNLLTC